jgi:hypothetical protein
VAQLFSLAEDPCVMTIQEFPLAWRWTDARYTVFPADVLSQLSPYSPDEASRLFERAKVLSRSDDFTALRISADSPLEQVTAWLRTQQPRLTEEVSVCWSGDTALRTHWSTFIERWDDFCYPSSDDVMVLPHSGSWMLMYHHSNEFEFRHKPAANKTMQATAATPRS